MELTKTGTFDGRLRLIYSRSEDGGASYSKEQDVTTTVSSGSTRIRGTAQWSDVKLAVAVESEAVPTVGQWGMILLVLLMLTASSVLLAQRRLATGGGSHIEHAAPALFVPRIFARTLAGAAVTALAALAASSRLGLAPSTADVLGSLATAGILAYLAQLWIALKAGSSSDK
jgi:hypothetical protein